MTAVPYVDLVKQNSALRPNILAAIDRVLCHGQFINGPEVREFEEGLARRLGVVDVVGVASGTAALTLTMRALGIGPGDEVVTVAHSYVATATAIILVGARPVLVDIDPATGLMDADRLAEAISPQTKAVIPVHLGGIPCVMKPIQELCERRGLHLIEDCAQAIGATHRGQSVGSFGTGCFSLHPVKTLAACGDAGFITVQDTGLAEHLRQLRSLGHRDRDHVEAIGENARLDTLQAAILLAKLPRLDGWIAARRAHAEAYETKLGPFFELTKTTEDSEPAYTTFVLRHDRRDDLIAHLVSRGFAPQVHYPIAIHRQQVLQGTSQPQLPHTETLVRRIVSLPVTPELDPSDRDALIDVLIQWSQRDA